MEMEQANKKIREGKEDQQRPANARRLRSRQFPTGLTFHFLAITDFVCEHYYNNLAGNSSSCKLDY